MTITPKQAIEHVSEGNRKKIEELEQRIDSVLMSDSFDGNSVTVGIGYVGTKVQREIERMYTEAGWNVTYHSDQRDGDYLQFKIKGLPQVDYR